MIKKYSKKNICYQFLILSYSFKFKSIFNLTYKYAFFNIKSKITLNFYLRPK